MLLRKLMVTLCTLILTASFAHADLNGFVHDLNVSAQADIGGFRTSLGARFNVAKAQIDYVMGSVTSPADAAMVFWLGEQSHQPLDRVMHVYRNQKSQGWGAMAQSLGIKPGSDAFHNLKQGNIGFAPGKGGKAEKSKAKSNGKDGGKSKKKKG